MPSLAQAKYQQVVSRAEREVLFNLMLKGELIKVDDVMEVYREKLLTARNRILAIPAQLADVLSREQVEHVRQIINTVLTEASKVGINDLQAKSEMSKFIKAAASRGS
jgi:hypothetical protein